MAPTQPLRVQSGRGARLFLRHRHGQPPVSVRAASHSAAPACTNDAEQASTSASSAVMHEDSGFGRRQALMSVLSLAGMSVAASGLALPVPQVCVVLPQTIARQSRGS